MRLFNLIEQQNVIQSWWKWFCLLSVSSVKLHDSPLRFETMCFSDKSEQSVGTIIQWSNISEHNSLASSVFPSSVFPSSVFPRPLLPQTRKEAIGTVGRARPARERKQATDIFCTASGRPYTHRDSGIQQACSLSLCKFHHRNSSPPSNQSSHMLCGKYVSR